MNKAEIKSYRFVLFLVAVMWVLEFINLVLGHRLNEYALHPRQVEKLYGIVTMHFLHWNLAHIFSNSIPLVILGLFVSAHGKVRQVTFFIMFLSGLMVWLLARDGVHAGASGLVMGYWGYLISSAIFERSLKNIFIAVLTIAIYGGIVFSLIDFRASISFEGHIFGFLAGVISAWIFKVSNKNQ